MAQLKTLPGFRVFYPDDFSKLQFIIRKWRQSAVVYGFQEYDAPVLEPLDLYKAKSGSEIEGQLFNFTDKGGREVTLRPEMTPSVTRMVGERANSLKKPIKWVNIGENFRYERQQKGRLRSFYQLNADIYGEAGAEAEVELIAFLVESLCCFGLSEEDFYIRLSDRDLWVYYLTSKDISLEAAQDILSVVDKMERDSEEESLKKLQKILGEGSVETLYSELKKMTQIRSLEELEAFFADRSGNGGGSTALKERLADWQKLLGGLDAMGLSSFVQVDLGVVRGLAYYTGFVFEAFDRKGKFRALAGGGRYNHLVKKLGGPDLPAVGFGMGDVVLHELLVDRGLMPEMVSSPDIYVIVGGEEERKSALKDIFNLRQAGYRIEYSLKEMAFAKQFKQAAQSGAKITLIYGAEELEKGVVKMRDMAGREEVELPLSRLFESIRDFFSG
ncbi:MAG: histidine--tRNA ligase [Opitutaceae bacterium]|nr:histidine--tRNA ligase [Opitutaceae bacterium]